MTAPVQTTTPPAAAHAAGRRRWLGMVVISLGVSLIVIDATILNVLLPRMIGDLRLTTADAEWMNSAYSLAFAALLITFGRMGDLFGRRRMFVLGSVVFMAASVLVACSSAALPLILSRAVQGVGAAMIMPATLSTVNTMFTGRDRHIAFGIWGSMIGGMAAVGPLLGGWLATSFDWRWAFLVNIPLGLILIKGALSSVPETRDPATAGGLDWPGAILSALGLGGLVFAVIEGQTYGWWMATRHVAGLGGLSPVPIAAIAAILLIGALLVVERARAAAGRPVMLDLTLFRIASFRQGNAASALISVGELGLLFVLPLFLQNSRDNSPLQVCVAVVPLALGSFLSGAVAHRFTRRYGPAAVVRIGMVLEVAATLLMALTTHAGTTGLDVAPWMFVYGVGLGLTSAQLTNVSLAGIPRGLSGQASGTQSTARQIGSALGIAIVGTVFATGLGHAMRGELNHTSVPPAQRPALAQELRDSAGTYARTARPLGDAEVTRAADRALATAADRGLLVTAGILLLGLGVTLRLRTPGE